MLTERVLRQASFEDCGDLLNSSDTDSIAVNSNEHKKETIQELALRFESQGMQCDLRSNKLWCLYCTAFAIRSTARPLASCLMVVGSTEHDIRSHCRTRDHLLRFEEQSAVQHACPVRLHGQKMLLENHCIYPTATFGPGKALMDHSISQGVILSQDVCGGVKLMPHHEYSVVELVLPFGRTTNLLEVQKLPNSRRAPEQGGRDHASTVMLPTFDRKRVRDTIEMLERANMAIATTLIDLKESDLINNKAD